MMRRALSIILSLVLLFAAPFAAGESSEQSALSSASPPQISARGAILIDAASGRVLYEQNADQMLPMASITKVMTALIAIENCSPDEIVTASANASGMPGTSIYLGVGEQLTMYQMLQGLMLRSGNDAAVAIAEHIAGSVEAFAALMNERAAALGADASFVNPHGLDADGHSISARGMALIAREAMTKPLFREIVGTKQATIPWVGNEYSRVLRNKNRLLSELDGATGIKTGFTGDAGRCLVFSAERDGAEYIGVVLNCGNWFDAGAMLINWAFDEYESAQIARAGDIAGQCRITGGTAPLVTAIYDGALSVPVAPGESWSVKLDLPEYLLAPVTSGQVVGRAYALVDGVVQAECDLVAAGDVYEQSFISIFSRIYANWLYVRRQEYK